jgi:hypothetical protein
MTRISALAVCLFLVAACGGSSPSTPSASKPVSYPAATITLAANAARANQSIFGASSADFARCLLAAGDAACFSATRMSVHAFVANAVAPGGPSNLVATSSGGTVRLTWSAPASGDAASAYIIEAGSAQGLANLANFSTGNSSTTFSADGVGNGTYYVRVRAQNGAGTGAASNEATLVVGATACSGAPAAPLGLTGSASGGTVTLAWSAPSGGCALSSYVLQAGSAAGLNDLANAATGTGTSYTATGVPSGSYFIRVRAQNASGLSAASNEVVVTVGAAKAAIAVVATPNPVQYTSAQGVCSAGNGSWVYNQTIQETGGVGATVRSRTNVIDGTASTTLPVNYVIAANGTFNGGVQTWCNTAAGASRASTVVTVWTGTDARGVAFSYSQPIVTLLANGTTTATPRFFPATWISASWAAPGSPTNSRGIEAPNTFGFICPPNSMKLMNHPVDDTFEDIGGALWVINTSCTPTMHDVAFCRTSGSGGGASQVPICSIDPRKTPFNNMTFLHSVAQTGKGSLVGSSPVNFDINVFWCSETSRMNFGTYANLDNTDCIEK